MDIDLMFNISPVCPFCHKVMPDDYLYDIGGEAYEEGVFSYECGNCEKDVKVQVNVEFTYTTCTDELEDYYEE